MLFLHTPFHPLKHAATLNTASTASCMYPLAQYQLSLQTSPGYALAIPFGDHLPQGGQLQNLLSEDGELVCPQKGRVPGLLDVPSCSTHMVQC